MDQEAAGRAGRLILVRSLEFGVMSVVQKRALGAVVSAAVTLLLAVLGHYLTLPAEVQVSLYGLIAAVAAFWQIEVTPPPGPKA